MDSHAQNASTKIKLIIIERVQDCVNINFMLRELFEQIPSSILNEPVMNDH